MLKNCTSESVWYTFLLVFSHSLITAILNIFVSLRCERPNVCSLFIHMTLKMTLSIQPSLAGSQCSFLLLLIKMFSRYFCALGLSLITSTVYLTFIVMMYIFLDDWILGVGSHCINIFFVTFVGQSFSEFTCSGKDVARKESLVAEAELASVFHQLLQEQGQAQANPEQEFSTEVRLTVNSKRRSLDNIWRSSKSQNSSAPYFKYNISETVLHNYWAIQIANGP